MAKVRGTSNAPMILGIIGGVLGLPAAICTGMCASAASSLVEQTGVEVDADTAASLTSLANVAQYAMYIGIVGAILAIIFACFAKKNPVLSGIMLLVSAVLTGVAVVIAFNILSLISAILLIIAAIIAFVQKKETIGE